MITSLILRQIYFPWRLCDLTGPSSTLVDSGVDSGADSEHKCGIATLAEEYLQESSAKTRERDPGQRLLRELLGHLLSKVYESLGRIRPASARRTPLLFPPAQSLEPRALNES